MQSTATKTESTTATTIAHNKYTRQPHIFAVQLYDNRIVIGIDEDACRRIAVLNSGNVKGFPDSHMVRHIIGIEPANETRSLQSVVAQFCRKYGEERVVCI